jgi:LysM domain
MRALGLALLLALLPAAALAAEASAASASQDDAQPAAPAPAPDEAAPAPAPAEAETPPPAADATSLAEPGKAPPVAGDDYVVKPGDTLWDLSGRFLNNPWYWPKVWSYNPQITNPHFIYPGSVVRFYPGAEEAPGQLAPSDAVAGPVPAATEGGEIEPAPRELDDLTRADMKKPQEFGEGDDVAVVGPYKIGYVPPKGLYARRESFVTPRELAESGVLHAAFEEKSMLSLHDRAYAKFSEPGRVKVGESYLLYKTDRAVTHPVTKELFGYKSTIIGTAKVVALDDKAATIEIMAAYDPIERGALVGPWTEKMVKQVRRRPNRQALDGFIVATQTDLVSEIGEHHVVFIDKGKQDGVEEGNLFTVVRSGDPYGKPADEAQRDPRFPIEDVGSLLVVDAQQTSSAALVVKSLRELYVGDKVEMRASTAPVAPAAGSGSN